MSPGLILICLAACTSPLASVPGAEPWPAADALFQRDPRWLGGDAVYSVDLGGDRILWLFGDSFVALDAQGDRRRSTMVRNSLAVQTGRDPESATLAFHWRVGDDGQPAAFFGGDGEHGFWPLHGIRLVDGPLLLFQTLVRATPGVGLGFQIDGWRILCIDEPDLDAKQWRWRELPLPPMPLACAVGTAVWRDGDHVVALATVGNGPHRGMLTRMAVADLLRFEVRLQWWHGEGWQEAPIGGPAVVLDNAGPECSVDRVPDGGWLHLYSRGFGRTAVAEHRAEQVTGPWSQPRDVFTPPESLRDGAFVYAAKGHPALAAGPGRLAVSYATNSFEFGDLFTSRGQRELYWPRFWRIPSGFRMGDAVRPCAEPVGRR